MKDVDAFESAFVAVSFLLGRRGDVLSALTSPGDAAARVARIAALPDQAERARRIAVEILPIATSFEARRLT
jgi:hypothetical protein